MMKSWGGHLRIILKIKTKNPIELGDFVSEFTSIASQYDKFIRRSDTSALLSSNSRWDSLTGCPSNRQQLRFHLGCRRGCESIFMAIRFIGSLLCAGLLVLAVPTGAVAAGKAKKQTTVDEKVGGSVMVALQIRLKGPKKGLKKGPVDPYGNAKRTKSINTR
jgi:hypothetical protein